MNLKLKVRKKIPGIYTSIEKSTRFSAFYARKYYVLKFLIFFKTIRNIFYREACFLPFPGHKQLTCIVNIKPYLCSSFRKMAEDLIISGNTRRERYEMLFPQLRALIGDEKDLIANLANISAALRETFGFFWVGFYWVRNDELVLGPFQGSVACTRIALGKGVCGAAWQTRKTQLVPDVEAFPGHIACSALSKSEIVVPILHGETVLGVLDVDSDKLNDFDETDVEFLEQLCVWISSFSV